MNFFRKKKQKEAVKTYRNQEELLISQLYSVLKTHGDAILRGKTKLTLTAPILITLNGYFQRITEGVNEACFQVTALDEDNERVQLIPFIFDFIQKVIALKLTPGAVASNCPLLNLEYFKALQVLEIRRIEVSLVKGLFLIRRQLKKLICYHATHSVHGIIIAFGRNGEDFQSLSSLESLEIGYNQVESLDDEAFKCFPALTSLDASYNSITCANSQTIPPLKYLNLACNMVHNIPIFDHNVSQALTTLILRNNNLNTLEGIQNFTSLLYLDVAENCIVEFKDIVYLALLEKLTNLIMSGNPVCYKPEYRFCVVRSLSPVKRRTKIIFDGIQLNSSELCHLGGNVQPVALTAYLSDNPLSRRREEGNRLSRGNSITRGSVEDFNVSSSFVTSPLRESTPSNNRSKESKKVRNAVIVEAGAQRDVSSFEKRQRNGSLINTYLGGSHRNSIDCSISSSTGKGSDSLQNTRKLNYDSWVEEESRRSIEFSNNSDNISDDFDSTSDLESLSTSRDDAADFYDTAPMSISNVVKELNNDKNNIIHTLTSVKSDEYVDHESYYNDDEVTVITDNGEAEYAYLVESINNRSKDDGFSSGDVENLFVIFKLPYLIEKGDDGIMKKRLDLDYLENLDFKNKREDLRIVLHFDLVRLDCKYREYKFAEQEQFDSFVDAIQPIFVKNRQKRLSEMKFCECLKCGTVFYNREDYGNESNLICPKKDCLSQMVIEKRTNEIDVLDERDNDLSDEEEYEINNTFDGDCNRSSIHDDDSSIAIVIPSYKKDENNPTPVSSWPNCYESRFEGNIERNHMSKSLPSNETLLKQQQQQRQQQRDDGKEEKVTDHCNSQKQTKKQVDANTDNTGANIYSKFDKCSGSRTYSASPGSLGSSSQSSRSCGHSRQSSKGLQRKKLSRSALHTPVTSTSEHLFSNMNDPTKCDHRLKLYFNMKLFSHQSEEFLCQINCYVVGYDKPNIYNTLLVVSTRFLYVFTITDSKSEVPEECLKMNSSSSLDDLRFVSRGYLCQSFVLDSRKCGFRYKFLVGDTTRTNHFVDLLENYFQNEISFKTGIPVIIRQPNPQTIADIRKQAFNVSEETLEMGQRIHEQILQYTSPPLLKNKKMRIRNHQQCFIAKDFLDWLLARKEAQTRSEAVKLAQQLLDAGTIFHVSKEQTFKDDDGIYKFSQSADNKSTTSITSSVDGETSDIDYDDDEGNNIDTTVQLYNIVQCRMNRVDTSLEIRTIILTNSHIFLMDESHQWPLSRLHSPPVHLTQHYTKKDSNKITNITSIEFYDDAPSYATILFVSENSSTDDDGESNWLVRCESIEELNKLVDAIRHIWEDLFAIELNVSVQSTIIPTLDFYVLV